MQILQNFRVTTICLSYVWKKRVGYTSEYTLVFRNEIGEKA